MRKAHEFVMVVVPHWTPHDTLVFPTTVVVKFPFARLSRNVFRTVSVENVIDTDRI
jgi:hypothetical protein